MFCFNAVSVFDIFFNQLKVQRTCSLVSGDNNIFIINMNKVGYYIQLDILERSVDIDYVSTQIFDKVFCIVDAHRDYNLFV